MRYIAISLLLANLAYLGWNLSRPAAELPASPDRPLLNTGLTLLSEYQAQQSASQAAPQTDTRCLGFAGFTSVDDANDFLFDARQRGFRGLLVLNGDALPAEYRLLLPPASSRAMATLNLDQLSSAAAAAGVEIDTYLITRGSRQNGVALGLFPDSRAAEQMRAVVAELGFAPLIEELPRATGATEVWLRLPAGTSPEPAESLDFAAQRPDLTSRENLCETIAQATRFQ